MQRGKVRSISKREGDRSGRDQAENRCRNRHGNSGWWKVPELAVLLAPLLASGCLDGPQRQTASGCQPVSRPAAVVSSRVLPSSGVGRCCCCSMGHEIQRLSTACSPRFLRFWTVSGRVPGARSEQGAAFLYASARDRPAQRLAAGGLHPLSSGTAILPREWCQVSMCCCRRLRSPNAASKEGRRGLPSPRSLGLSREKPSGPKSSIDLEMVPDIHSCKLPG